MTTKTTTWTFRQQTTEWRSAKRNGWALEVWETKGGRWYYTAMKDGREHRPRAVFSTLEGALSAAESFADGAA